MRAGVDTPPKESAREKLAPARRGLLRLCPEEDFDTGFMIVVGFATGLAIGLREIYKG